MSIDVKADIEHKSNEIKLPMLQVIELQLQKRTDAGCRALLCGISRSPKGTHNRMQPLLPGKVTSFRGGLLSWIVLLTGVAAKQWEVRIRVLKVGDRIHSCKQQES